MIESLMPEMDGATKEYYLNYYQKPKTMSKLNLFHIQEEYLQITSAIIDADGEITEELETALVLNRDNLQTKAVNYGYVIMQWNSEVDQIEAEIKRLTALKKARVKAAESLKDRIQSAMEKFEMLEVQTPTLKMNFRKSDSVEIVNINQIPAEYIKERKLKEDDISKSAIKAAIKSGASIPGAILNYNNNLQIK
jgi:hypothetical protein